MGFAKHFMQVTTLLIALALMVSCSQRKDHDNVISLPDFVTDANIKVILNQNDTLKIVLRSSPDSTGYDWSLEFNNPDIVKIISKKYVADKLPRGYTGGGGNSIWTFHTGSKGDVLLKFKYERDWEKGIPPSGVISFAINVR